MAFVPAQNNSRNANANDDWKAQGFINVYLPTSDGGRKKVGALPLRASKPAEAFVLGRLEKNPDSAKELVGKLIIEYQSAEPKGGFEFVLE